MMRGLCENCGEKSASHIVKYKPLEKGPMTPVCEDCYEAWQIEKEESK